MSAESAYLSTFGAETETEAEIRSTSTSRACQYYISTDATQDDDRPNTQ